MNWNHGGPVPESRSVFPGGLDVFILAGYTNSHISSSSAFTRSLPRPLTFTPSQRASRSAVVCNLFGLGLPELLVVGGVALVLFGPSKLPEVGKSLGKTVKGFQEVSGRTCS